jgi:dipeptide transport system ATP-binding protein
VALLDIRNLTVRFGTASGSFTAVEGVDIAVDPGEVLAIVGESGSGKSVAMLAVMDLLPWTATVTADRLAFDGADLLAMPQRQRRALAGGEMSMIFQEPMSSLNPCFTVEAQIDEMLRAHTDLGRRERREQAEELLHQVGIPDPKRRLSAYPHQLSGGMSQRVMIAMAIACQPRLLIADEPTTAQILDLLLELQAQYGMALILITHDMGVVAETAHRVAVHYAGWRVETQPVRELFRAPRHPYTAALLASLPERAGDASRLPVIPGVVPGQFDRPEGCLFWPRCTLADELCRTTLPSVRPGDPAHALCHHPLGESPS